MSKKAIITGGNSGIGAGLARKLASEGYSVYIVGRNEETMNKIVQELKSKYET